MSTTKPTLPTVEQLKAKYPDAQRWSEACNEGYCVAGAFLQEVSPNFQLVPYSYPDILELAAAFEIIAETLGTKKASEHLFDYAEYILAANDRSHMDEAWDYLDQAIKLIQPGAQQP